MSQERPSELEVIRNQKKELDDMEMNLYGAVGRLLDMLDKILDRAKRLEEIKGTEITADRLKDAREFLHTAIYGITWTIAENTQRITMLHELRRKLVEKYVELLGIQ